MRGRRRYHRFASLPASLALLAGVTAIGAATSCASGTGTGSSQTLSIYGRLPSLANAVPGSYTDTVTVIRFSAIKS